ncbi:MAG: Uma2 family endonuclease [Lachnospiraceae bacterium]|jgi:Uma2 family endonuclease|nr:Uma2 family endonuclease [Lachnospiraceae bacterium]
MPESAHERLEDEKEERIYGVIYSMSPSGGLRHAAVNGNIHGALREKLKGNLCIVTMENVDIYMADGDYVTPDVMIICDRKNKKGEKYTGVPRFVVETLSRSTRAKDMSVKKRRYQDLGVEEYWLVDPKGNSVDIYYLEEGVYALHDSVTFVDDPEDDDNNPDKSICLRAFPHIGLSLEVIFADPWKDE